MSTSILAPDRPRASWLVKKYPLAVFFVLVLGLTWPYMIWDALATRGILPPAPIPVLLLQAYMPTLVALLVTGLTKGRAGIRALFGKLLIARVGFRWYAFAIFGMAGLFIAAVLLANQFGPSPALPILSDEMSALSSPVAILLNATILFLVHGILNGEELAWRGFALPKLQAKYNALTSSLILSIPWILFHLPYFFDPSKHMGPFVSFAIRIVALTILITWMFNHTRGSALLAYILHAAANTWPGVLSIDSTYQFQDWMTTIVTVILAIIVVIQTGPENLSRTNARIQE